MAIDDFDAVFMRYALETFHLASTFQVKFEKIWMRDASVPNKIGKRLVNHTQSSCVENSADVSVVRNLVSASKAAIVNVMEPIVHIACASNIHLTLPSNWVILDVISIFVVVCFGDPLSNLGALVRVRMVTNEGLQSRKGDFLGITTRDDTVEYAIGILHYATTEAT